MKTTLSALAATAAAVVLALGFAGCNTSPTGGNEGKDTFKITGPSGTTDVKQGDTKSETVTITRGKDFKQDLKFSVQNPPKGVTVDFDPATVKASDKGETSMKIHAAKDAALGEGSFQVIAKPDSGTSVPLGVKIKVTESK